MIGGPFGGIPFGGYSYPSSPSDKDDSQADADPDALPRAVRGFFDDKIDVADEAHAHDEADVQRRSVGFVVANAQARQAAIDGFEAALVALEGMESGTLEADVAKHLVAPMVRSAIGALQLNSDDILELAKAQGKLEEARGFLENALEIFKRYGPALLVNLVSNGLTALAVALASH